MKPGNRLGANPPVVTVLIAALLTAGCASPGLTSDPLPPKTQQQLDAEAWCATQRLPATDLPPKRFTTDGCSAWPDGNYGHCCVTHDIAYWCGGDSDARRAADGALRQCVADAGHPRLAPWMELGTRIGGWHLWPLPWRWGYGWYWPGRGRP